MAGRRSAGARLIGLLLLAAVVGTGPAASAAAGAAQRAAAAGPVSGELAVRGPHNHVYVAQADTPGSFAALGGQVLSTPAITFDAQTHSDYVVGVGTDHMLWIFDHGTGGWRHLVDSGGPTCAYAPALAATGSTLGVACTSATTGHLLAATVTLPADGSAPTVSALVDQGGLSRTGPALFFAGDSLDAWVVSRPDPLGDVYARDTADPYNVFARVPTWCRSQPAVTAPPGAAGYFAGCQSGNPGAYGGTANSMRWQTATGQGVSGTMVGPVGIARSADNSSASYFVTDLHGVVWRADVTSTGVPSWTRFGGHAQPGVSAVEFRVPNTQH